MSEKIISTSNVLGNEDEKSRIAFSKFPSDSVANYTICTFGLNIYLLKDHKLMNYINSKFDRIPKEIIPYKVENGIHLQYIIGAISNNYLYFQFYNLTELKFEKQINFREETGKNLDFFDNVISCQLMNFKNLEKLSLICFTELISDDGESFQLSANIFDIENNFSTIGYLFYSDINDGIGAIKSITSEDKKKCYICYVRNNYITECVIYNSEKNLWGQTFKIFDSCINKNYFIDFIYLNDIKEYIFYCFYGRLTLNIFSFDNNFNLKKINSNNGNYNNKTFILKNIKNVYSSSFVYLPEINKYFLLYTYKNPSSYNIPFFNETELCINEKSIYDCQQILNETIINNTININSTNNIKETNILKQNINFTYNGNIYEAELNMTKEEMLNNLDNIIKLIEIGNNYKLVENNYDIIISPINNYKNMNSTYIDFDECTDILRTKYNLSSEEIITILQIEIKCTNEKILTDQIEYTLFDEEKNKLDLSFCQNIPITIDYKIKNSSLINDKMISHYSDLNIDIFNIEDSFFNDICYPFSDNKADLVLNDRVNDIYQNYSLCENNCVYKEIDAESLTVKCQCNVKEEIDIEEKPPIFSQIVKNSFADSNFGVIRCFNKVFCLTDKINNIGFWISIIIISLHIVLFIIFFIYKLNSIKVFIFKEIEKNNYIDKNNYPPKIKTKNSLKSYSKNIHKTENIEVIIPNKIQYEVNSNNSKIKRIKKYKKKNQSLKNLRYLTNYNTSDDPKTNELLSISDKKSELILRTSTKKIKIEKNEKIEVFNKGNLIDKEFGKTIKHKKSNKKVKFYDLKYLDSNNNENSSINKLPKKKFSKLLVSNLRRSQKGISIPTSEIFKKLLGNEEAKSFPGFYNLIHINANNDSYNRPLDSKYILDNYVYETAIKYDDRSFWRIYYICLLSKENILNTFFFKSPLELTSIRLCLFLFNYSCDFALNALFYLNQNISDRYHYKGKNLFFYSIVNNITISTTSSLCSFILGHLLSFFTNSKDDIILIFRKEEEKMRKDKNYKINLSKKAQIIKKLNIIFHNLFYKIILFIIIESLILFFFFYYMIAFCGVYKQTQMSWLTDCGVSFLVSIPLELSISFILTVLYTISIRYHLRFVYKIVLFFYNIG